MNRLRSQHCTFGWLSDAHKQILLLLARRTIQQFFVDELLPQGKHPDKALNRKQGAFVTLMKEGKLRGCVGHIKNDLPLYETVGLMALQSAINDHRFSPLTADELPQIEIEISILSPFKKIKRIKEIELGQDGVSLRIGDHHAVFLPQVALKMGWEREQLLDRLANKMGLPEKSWKRRSKVYIFQTEMFKESDYSGLVLDESSGWA